MPLGSNPHFPQRPAKPCPHLFDILPPFPHPGLLCSSHNGLFFLLLQYCACSGHKAFACAIPQPRTIYCLALNKTGCFLTGHIHMSPSLEPFSDHAKLVLPVALFYFTGNSWYSLKLSYSLCYFLCGLLPNVFPVHHDAYLLAEQINLLYSLR